MSEYISREELIDRLRKTELSADQIRMLVYPKEAVVGAIYDCPPADVRPNIHGYWEAGNNICPKCGEDKFKGLEADIYADWQPNFCPNCGADMREPKGEKGD